MNSRAANLWLQIRSSLWFVPRVMALLAAGLAWLTLTLDHRSGLLPKDSGWFWSGEGSLYPLEGEGEGDRKRPWL